MTTLAELGAVERARWEEIRRGDPALASPFFAFDFAAAVAAVRRDVRVGVLRGRGGGPIVGFFPFQVSRVGAGRPVGGKLSDYHGVIVEPGVSWDVRALLKGCGLRSLRFNHLIGSQRQFRPHFASVAASPVVDLDDPAKPPPGSPSQADRKRRRLERRAPLRLELRSASAGALRTLLEWKSSQYARTGAFDAVARPWVAELLERLRQTRTEFFEGMLCCLWCGDELVAAHFGLRSGRVLHWWFPAYDAAFARDSPGLVQIRMLLDAAPAEGIGVLDFGKGDEDYKTAFANGAIEVGIGAVETDRFSAARAAAARAAWDRVLRSRLYRPANHVRRRLDFR